MGAIFAEEILEIARPRVGLLSIGEEPEKGNQLTLEAHRLLAESDLDFAGNVESRWLLDGGADVVVCDGFVGNVILKFYESAGRMFMGMMKQAFPDVLGRPEARQLFKFLDYSEYGGAPLLGVKGVVIICHGASPARAIKNAVRVAAQMVTSRLDQDIGAELAEGGASR
jgi:glycerol-3-phosphate acyltransferase PlsX